MKKCKNSIVGTVYDEFYRDEYKYNNPDTLEVLLRIQERSNDYEFDRSKLFDTKSSTLLALSGVGIVAMTRFTDTYKIFDVDIIGSRLITLSTIILLLLGGAIMCFMMVLLPKKFLKPDHKRYADDIIIHESKNKALDQVIQNYCQAISENEKINLKKSNWFKAGLIILGVGIFILILQYLYIFPYLYLR